MAPLGTLTPEHWRAWFVEKTTTHPGSTQPGKDYRLARAILNQSVGDGLFRHNPFQVRGAGCEHPDERPVAMPDEVARIAEAIDPRRRSMVLLAAYCSLRFGEVAGLRRSRIDLLHGTVKVAEQAVELSSSGRVVFKSPKADSHRAVAIPGELVAVLDEHLATSRGRRAGRARLHVR